MQVKITPREDPNVAQSKAHTEWQKANTVKLSLRLQKTTDADIIQFLDGKNKQAEIKRAVRLLIENEKG